MADALKTKRIEPGWYEITLPDGEVFEVKNMKGQSVLHSGSLEPHWHIEKKGGSTGYGWSGWSHYTLGDAKEDLRRYWDRKRGES